MVAGTVQRTTAGGRGHIVPAVCNDSGGVTICHLAGELEALTAAELRETSAALCGTARVVFDLSEVLFIDSAGLGALIGGIRRIRENGGEVVLCSARAPINRLLKTVGLDRVVSITATPAEAASRFGSAALA